MKLKSVLAIALLSLAGLNAEAGSVGPIAGLSMSSTTISTSGIGISTDSRTGFAFGATSEWSVNDDWLFFQPELMYIQKGGSVSAGTNSAEWKFNYFEIPLLMKAKLGTGGVVTPYFTFGPTIGFMASSAATLTQGNTVRSESINETNDFEASLNVGAGIETALADGVTGFFDLRYVHGLTNINQDPGDDSTAKNRTWLFLIGSRFDI